MNELKPEDVKQALAWYEVVGKNIGSVTIPYNELQAIAAQLREKDAEIERLKQEHKDYIEDTTALLSEKNAKCEKLMRENAVYANGVEKVAENYHRQGRAEAITEFAEKLKGRFNVWSNAMYSETTVQSVITKVIKEMEGTLRENNDCRRT